MHWLGGPSFVLELGVFRILCDPVFGDPASGKRAVALPAVDLGTIDLLLLTQNSEGHFDAAAMKVLDRAIAVAAPNDVEGRSAQNGFENVTGLDAWQEATRKRSGETLEVLAVPTEQPNGTPPTNGYLITHRAGDEMRTVYWMGDTRWFSDARRILERIERLDLLIPHLGAVGGDGPEATTLTGKEAMQFIFMFKPKRIVPINHHTFLHYTESVDDLAQRIGVTMYDRRLVLLKEGEIFER